VSPPPERVWRAFPWNPSSQEGEPFSASFIPPLQGKGRFDLPGVPGGVLYLAETPEHAVAERIQHFRGQSLGPADLRVARHDLALVSVGLSPQIRESLADLCDPALLLRYGIRPDETASRDRRTTQRIAADLHAAGHSGLRWWSALSGDWHTLALFRDRLDPTQPAYGTPEPITLEHPAVREAAHTLGIALEPT
jgi:hypothetical protein